MHTFMRVVMTGVCLSAGMMISAEAGETKAKREKAKGEVNGEFDEMKGEAKAVQEELKGNDTKAELERAKGKVKGAGGQRMVACALPYRGFLALTIRTAMGRATPCGPR